LTSEIVPITQIDEPICRSAAVGFSPSTSPSAAIPSISSIMPGNFSRSSAI